jgi:hypothetical protein
VITLGCRVFQIGNKQVRNCSSNVYMFSTKYHAHNGAVTSTALSTTARTLSANTRFAHSTSRSSSQTLATILSTLISTPGTGIPILCSLSISCLCNASSSLSPSSEPSVSPSPSSLMVEGDPGVGNLLVVILGMAIGLRLSGPNCASKNRNRRSRRSAGERFAWGFLVGSV